MNDILSNGSGNNKGRQVRESCRHAASRCRYHRTSPTLLSIGKDGRQIEGNTCLKSGRHQKLNVLYPISEIIVNLFLDYAGISEVLALVGVPGQGNLLRLEPL
jgi:hypothetical protein